MSKFHPGDLVEVAEGLFLSFDTINPNSIYTVETVFPEHVNPYNGELTPETIFLQETKQGWYSSYFSLVSANPHFEKEKWSNWFKNEFKKEIDYLKITRELCQSE